MKIILIPSSCPSTVSESTDDLSDPVTYRSIDATTSSPALYFRSQLRNFDVIVIDHSDVGSTYRPPVTTPKASPHRASYLSSSIMTCPNTFRCLEHTVIVAATPLQKLRVRCVRIYRGVITSLCHVQPPVHFFVLFISTRKLIRRLLIVRRHCTDLRASL